jgi:hypothetical protein
VNVADRAKKEYKGEVTEKATNRRCDKIENNDKKERERDREKERARR